KGEFIFDSFKETGFDVNFETLNFSKMKPFCFADGAIIPTESATIHPMDLGLIRGFGIFDFFRTSGHTPLFLEHYLDRFITSAEKTHLPLPYTRDQLRQVIKELIEKNEL